MPAKLRQAREALSAVSEDGAANRLTFALTVEDAVREADLAIDFVPDELESKLEIFSMIDRMAPPKTILCTPTRALSIGDLAACTYRADRCIALRADGSELQGGPLHLIPGRATSDNVIRRTQVWLQGLGVVTLVGRDDHVDAPAEPPTSTAFGL